MSHPAVLKSIKIKTAVLKRLLKEHSCYIKDTEMQTVRVEELKAEAKDEEEAYRVKKEQELLEETRAMIRDTARRANVALTDLKKALAEATLEECQELTDANEQVAAATAICTV